MPIDKFDYEEPACACDMKFYKEEKKISPIPVGRVIEKLNSLYDNAKLSDAESLIKYWIMEAEAGFDYKGKLTLLNELMGTQRKLGKKEDALKTASLALDLLEKLEMLDSPSGGMTKLNAGTVYKTFDNPNKAYECYKYAETMFEKYYEPCDERFGGLYNNLAACLMDLDRLEEAKVYLNKALEIASQFDYLQKETETIHINLNKCNELLKDSNLHGSHIKGMELAKSFYKDCFKETLYKDFPHLLDKLAIGLCGQGSECFGFDDVISEDHDFEPGFCIFIPGESIISRKDAFELQRAYDKMPRTYKGYTRPLVAPVGGSRHGVIRLEDYLSNYLGDLKSFSLFTWIETPSCVLSELTNGQIWLDNYGKLSSLRNTLKNIPRDVLLKKLAGKLLIAAQSGQYNLPRCISHKETDAAKLAAYEFVNAAMEIVFLLNRQYMPYYKWSFRAMDKLPILSYLKQSFSNMLNGNLDELSPICEEICTMIANELRKQNLTNVEGSGLEEIAYSINDAIEDNEIRSLNIFYGSK